jgi:hypothetical protein
MPEEINPTLRNRNIEPHSFVLTGIPQKISGCISYILISGTLPYGLMVILNLLRRME